MSTAPRLPFLLLLVCLLALQAGAARRAEAAGQANLSVTATPEIILADGKSDTTLTATVRDSGGGLAPDGTTVQFTTSLGTLAQDTAATQAGVARVRLISASADGVAAVSATAFIGSAGGAVGSTRVEFTSDREAIFTSGDARWIHVDCPQYLIYSADVRVIEAQGRNGSASLRYKNLSVQADALQLDLTTQTLLAHNAVVKRGRHTLRAARLRYDLSDATGTAVAADTGHVARTVDVAGADLSTTPQPYYQAQYSTENDIYQFADLFKSRVVISARAIAVDPGRTLQFRRAAIYTDGRKVLSLAYHVMPMDSDQPLGQQFVGFNSGGLALNLPFYYHVDTGGTGALFLRNSVVGTGDGNGPLDTTGTRPGWAIDLQQTYSLGLGGSGQFLVNGLTRSDWGAHWDHTQRLDDNTRGYFLLDYPAHRALFGSSNLSRQFGGFSLNMTASGSRDPGRNGFSSSSGSLNSYLETDPRPLGRSGLSFVTSAGTTIGQYVQQQPGQSRQVTPVSTRTLDVRLFSPALHPDARTSLSDAFTVGQSWGSGRSAPTLLLNLGLNRQAPGSGSLGLNYTWRYDPLFSQLGTDPAGTGLLGAFYHSASQQRLTLNYAAQPSRRLAFSFSGGYGLPLGDTNVYSNVQYRLNANWGVGAGAFFDRYLGDNYHEMQLSVSRRIFSRDLTFTYSTLTRKVRFDFAGASF